MGYFTWMFADKNNKGKLNYGEKGFVACPDGTFIGERFYDGYGIFGGYDVYELVVDWNKEHLVEIFSRHLKSDWNHLLPVAKAYVEGKEEAKIRKIYKETICAKNNNNIPAVFLQSWKRNLGIAIACYDEDNETLPFPIKIVSNTNCKYDELPASQGCQ